MALSVGGTAGRQTVGIAMKVNPSSSESIDGYIAGFPEAVQHVLERVRAVIQAAAPDAQEAIKYRLPTFLLNGNLVHFGAFKNHIGFYPTPSGIEKFKDDLSVYKTEARAKTSGGKTRPVWSSTWFCCFLGDSRSGEPTPDQTAPIKTRALRVASSNLANSSSFTSPAARMRASCRNAVERRRSSKRSPRTRFCRSISRVRDSKRFRSHSDGVSRMTRILARACE